MLAETTLKKPSVTVSSKSLKFKTVDGRENNFAPPLCLQFTSTHNEMRFSAYLGVKPLGHDPWLNFSGDMVN